MVKAIVGANWGDEGKGKITDILAKDSDIVIRFQGGSNAGHTIINNFGRFALHQLPSGVFYSHVTNIIGNAVALNVENFTNELNELKKSGINPKIFISNRTQLVMPYHILFDIYEEERLRSEKFGSTKSGISPFYADKYAKIGFQVNELFDDENSLKQKIHKVLEVKNFILKNLYHKPTLSETDVFNKLMEYKNLVSPYVIDTFNFIYEAIKADKNILLEGQLGALKDTDFGIYPMVTSSNTIAGYGSVGTGIPPYKIKEIVTVVKAYSSSVGAGAFVSEIFGAEAEALRKKGGDKGEYGATTGRPRRMGWLDLVATRYGCRVQGATSVAFTVLDALGYLDEIPVCVAYEIDGKTVDCFPTTNALKRAKPILKTMPGWKSDIQGIKKYEKLPKECRDYIEFAENQIGVPIKIVSNGPKREDIIYK